MSPHPHIFVSAVTAELKSARQLVANTLKFLGYEPVWQDIFGTEGGDLREVLRKKIQGCKGVVQLVGKCYGTEPSQPDPKFGRVSYTQFEALYARDCGKKVWYLFIDEDFAIDRRLDEPAELRELQAAYRHHLQSDTHVYHELTTREAVEGSILKMRDDLARLRRGARRWSAAVMGFLVLLTVLGVWLLRSQHHERHLIEQHSEKVDALMDRYHKMEQAMAGLAEAEAQSKQPATKMTPEEQRAAAYATLEQQLNLSPGTLAKEMPAFALQLYNRSDVTVLTRAQAAYALGRFEEAERLSVEAATTEQRAYEAAQHAQEERRKSAFRALLLAGQSAQQRVQYENAMRHFREAEKLTQRDRDPDDWATIGYAIATLLLDQGDFRNAEALLSQVVQVRSRFNGADNPETLRTRNVYAYALVRVGKVAEAEMQFRDIIQIQRRILGEENPATLSSMLRLGIALLTEGKYAEAETLHRQLVKTSEKVLGTNHGDTLTTRSNLAVALENQGKYAEAEAENRAVLTLRQKTLGSTHPDTIMSHSNLANDLLSQNKIADAMTEYRAADVLYQKVLGPQHPETLRNRTNMTLAMEAFGHYAEAEAELREILHLKEKALGPEHSETLHTRSSLAVALLNEDKYSEAEAEGRDVIRLQTKTLGPEHPATLAARVNLAAALQKQGKFVEAESEARDTLKLLEKVVGPSHPYTFFAREHLALVLFFENKYAEAEAIMRELISVLGKTGGSNDADTIVVYYDFATGLAREDKRDEAETFARQAVERARTILGAEHPETRKYEALLAKLAKD